MRLASRISLVVGILIALVNGGRCVYYAGKRDGRREVQAYGDRVQHDFDECIALVKTNRVACERNFSAMQALAQECVDACAVLVEARRP